MKLSESSERYALSDSPIFTSWEEKEMHIITECEKTLMYKITWRDAYGEINKDYVIMNNSEPEYTAAEWKKAAVAIIMETNKGKFLNITEATQVKHDNIYIAVV